jgi:hypothetical protein
MAGNRSPSALSIKNQTRDRVTLHLRGALPLGFLETSQSKNPAQDRHFRALHAVPSYGDVIPRPGVFGRASGDAPDARRSDGRWVPSTYRWKCSRAFSIDWTGTFKDLDASRPKRGGAAAPAVS